MRLPSDATGLPRGASRSPLQKTIDYFQMPRPCAVDCYAFLLTELHERKAPRHKAVAFNCAGRVVSSSKQKIHGASPWYSSTWRTILHGDLGFVIDGKEVTGLSDDDFDGRYQDRFCRNLATGHQVIKQSRYCTERTFGGVDRLVGDNVQRRLSQFEAACMQRRAVPVSRHFMEYVMKIRFFPGVVVLAIVVINFGVASAKDQKPIKVFLLLGQSNMNGRGNIDVLKNKLTKDLPDKYPPSLVEIRRDVWITGANGNGISHQMSNVRLEPGFGQFDYFGPELAFGHAMGDYFDEEVLLVKCIGGGTPLATDWTSPSAAKRTNRQGPLNGRRAGFQKAFLG